MAKAKAHHSVDMLGLDFWRGVVTAFDAGRLQVEDGPRVVEYRGAFTHGADGDPAGRLDAVRESRDGVAWYDVREIGRDAALFFDLAESDGDAALAFVFSGRDLLEGSGGADRLLGFAGADTLLGHAGRDRLHGGAGDDRLDGGTGDDALRGDDGHDRLAGGSGCDVLHGGAGADRLAGGTGRDQLWGELGADVFVFAAASDAGRGGARDVVRDFRHAEGDRIDLRGIDAHPELRGDQAFRFLGGADFSERAGEVRFHHGVLSGDVDGDGRADFQIELNGVARLHAHDLLL